MGLGAATGGIGQRLGRADAFVVLANSQPQRTGWSGQLRQWRRAAGKFAEDGQIGNGGRNSRTADPLLACGQRQGSIAAPRNPEGGDLSRLKCVDRLAAAGKKPIEQRLALLDAVAPTQKPSGLIGSDIFSVAWQVD